MKLSEKAIQAQPSMTMALNTLAKQKQDQGLSIIAMVAGEPDFPTPDHIGMAGIRAISTGDTKYGASTGSIALREEIAKKFKEDNDLDFSASQVVVTSGSKPLLYTAFMAVCDPGDEVIIPAPYWVSYPSLVSLAGAKPVILPAAQENGYKITASALQAAITPNTRALLLNTPSNPTGAVYSKAELTSLLDVLRKHPSVYLVTDEIYEHLIYDGQRHCSPAALAPDMANRIIVINGFSKGYCMIGWRMGFAAGPQPVITAMGDFLSHIVGAPSTITHVAALAALQGPKPYLKTNRDNYQARRDLALDRIAHIPGLYCEKPGGAFFLFVDCAALLGKTTVKGTHIASDVDFAKAVIEEAGVAIVPGSAFGLPGHFRLSYSMSAEDIDQGLKRIAAFCSSLR